MITSQFVGLTIDSNGMCYFLAYTDASNGTIASVINTDYISLTVTFKHGDDLEAGDIAAGQMNTVKYDGTAFELVPNKQVSKTSQLTNDSNFPVKDGTVQTGLNAEKINTHTASATPLTTEKTDLVGMVNELFNNANNGKSSVATAIGSPTVATETFAQISADINTQKSNLATNLTNKGQTASASDTLSNLVAKVANIARGQVTAGNNIIYSDTSVNTAYPSTNYVCVRSVQVGRAGIYRVTFGLKWFGTGGSAYGQIWKNGAPCGTERINTTSTMTDYTEDLAFNAGDYIQLYMKGSTTTTNPQTNLFQVGIGGPTFATKVNTGY